MKKNFILASSLMAVMALVSCGSAVTSEEIDENVVNLTAALTAAKSSENGVLFYGSSTKKVEYSSDAISANNYEKSYTFEANFTASEYSSFMTELDESGKETDKVSSEAFFKNESGNLATERFAADGSVVLEEVEDYEGTRTLWSESRSNPFDTLSVADFTFSNDVYSVTGNAAQKFLFHLVGESYDNVSLKFTLDSSKEAFATLVVDEVSTTKKYVASHYYIDMKESISLNVEISAEANITHLTAPTEANEDLTAFLKKLAGGNFTLTIKMEDDTIGSKVYFTGEAVYFQYIYDADISTIMPYMYDFYFVKNETSGLMEAYYSDWDEDLNVIWTKNDPSVTGMYLTEKSYAELTNNNTVISAALFEESNVTSGSFKCNSLATEGVASVLVPGLVEAVGSDLGLNRSIINGCKGISGTFSSAEGVLDLDFTGVWGSNVSPSKGYLYYEFSDVGTTVSPFEVTLPE